MIKVFILVYLLNKLTSAKENNCNLALIMQMPHLFHGIRFSLLVIAFSLMNHHNIAANDLCPHFSSFSESLLHSFETIRPPKNYGIV
jgi:hypothetical protein